MKQVVCKYRIACSEECGHHEPHGENWHCKSQDGCALVTKQINERIVPTFSPCCISVDEYVNPIQGGK